MNPADIRRAAALELFEEARRAAIEAEKARLRARAGRSRFQRLLDRLFPYSITVTRKPQ